MNDKKETYCQQRLKFELRRMYEKFSDEDLIKMYNILNYLGLTGFNMAYCASILGERGYNIDNIPRSIRKYI